MWDQGMTEAEEIKQDMDVLLKSIRLQWADLASGPFDAAGIRQSIFRWIGELNALGERLGELPSY